jgi:hypothetical protein
MCLLRIWGGHHLSEKHAVKFVGVDEYMSPKQGRVSQSDCLTDSKESKSVSSEPTGEYTTRGLDWAKGSGSLVRGT